MEEKICGNCQSWSRRGYFRGRCMPELIDDPLFTDYDSKCQKNPSRFSPYAPEREVDKSFGTAEEICGNCKLFWKNTGQYLFNDCGTFDTDDNAPCEFNPPQFSSSQNQSVSEKHD